MPWPIRPAPITAIFSFFACMVIASSRRVAAIDIHHLPGAEIRGRRQKIDNDTHQILGLAEHADGVRIFIGSENKLFSLSGSSLIVAPFRDGERKVVGVLGVIGPTRLNYARIIPMVDYTARLVSRVLT